MRSLSLPEFSLAVRQRADLSGQQNAFGANGDGEITDAEMTSNVQHGIDKVWDVLTGKFGDMYAWGDGGSGTQQGYLISTTQGVYKYELPFDFYKMHGLDLALDSTLVNWAMIRPYTVRDRNLFSFPLQTVLAYAGWQNMRYQLQGQYINLLPMQGPVPGTLRLMYCPQAPQIVLTLPTAWVTLTAYAYGQLVKVQRVQDPIGTFQVFMCIVAGTTGAGPTLWNVPGTTADGTATWAYKGPFNAFATTFDGISGYEEMVILDACIQARAKQEADSSVFAQQFSAEVERINLAAANRQAGDPMVISGGFGAMEGGSPYGNGFGGGWG
jgi:hypothetical protein